MKKHIKVILISILALILLTGCSSVSKKDNKITIAEQYGLAYAPVQIIKELKLIEELKPELETDWKKLSNTAAIRESMLAGQVDIAFMAIPPFLIAKDKGMDWKIISSLSESPLALMTNQEHINKIADFSPEDKIALPQPGSIQHILLSMAAKRELGSATTFDKQLLTMKHPDAMNTLLSSKEISAHFASPPYLFLESKEKGIKNILTAKKAFGGDFSFIVGVSTEKFYEQHGENYHVFLKALTKSINFINENPKKAAEILADSYNLSEKELSEYLMWPGMKFSKEIKGLNSFIDFMAAEGYINKSDYSNSDLVFGEKEVEEDSLTKKEVDFSE